MTEQASKSMNDAAVLNGLAIIHMMFGLYPSALSLLALSNWVLKDNTETLRLLARAHFVLQKPRDVIRAIDRIQAVDPETPLQENDIVMKGRSYALLGQSEKARDILCAI